MKDQVRDLLKKRFPLCDDAYFDKVAGEIDTLYKSNVDYAGIDPIKWEGVTSGQVVDPLARMDKYFEE